jgi:two-component system OmpR family response regulator
LSSPTEPGSLDGAPRVLVVEDELKLAALIGKALTEQGMPADLASNGEDALQMAIAGSYDVLLVDVNLPGIDGFEVCRRLRARGVSTRILMLTAGDRIDERSVDADGCADDYMAKPFDFNELFARVRGLAGRESK